MNEIQGIQTVPEHVAVIMDGNGRWAKKKGVPRAMGHKAGCETLEKMVRVASDLGIRYFTVYGFSTENWKRSAEEVGALMQLMRYYLDNLVEGTKDNTGMVFIIAINYGGRDEIVRAARKLVEEYRDNGRDVSEIDEEAFNRHLDTHGLPDPDLLIRTSGEMRLSNYLLWQLAYTELYVTDCLWPDFNKEELEKAVTAYNGRERRFGGR